MPTKNTVPELLNALRPDLRDIAGWSGVSRGLAAFWVSGAFQPKPAARARLVRGVRKHAKALLELADAVEREGKERYANAKERFTWGPGDVERISAPKRRGRTVRVPRRTNRGRN